MKIQLIQEGEIKLKVPTENKYKAAVFYNPEAEMQRDISISVLSAWKNISREKIWICDALSASGVRGLRYAKEVKGVKEVLLNDHNPIAFKLIKQNIKLNKLTKFCKANWQNTNVLLQSKVFGFIDIDPFGTPNVFLDAAARSIWNKGFVAITATDTAPLSGTYPGTCFRKYGIKTIKGTEFYRELGIRNLITFTILTFSKYDRAFVPVVSHAKTHYFRIYGKIGPASAIEDLLKQIKFLNHCKKCLNRIFGEPKEKCECGSNFEIAGPVYSGPISDQDFCEAVLEDLKKRDFKQKKAELELLYMLVNEAKSPSLYFDVNAIGKIYKKVPPKLDILIEKLKSKGFAATRTHFCPTGVKTDAKITQLLECL